MTLGQRWVCCGSRSPGAMVTSSTRVVWFSSTTRWEPGAATTASSESGHGQRLGWFAAPCIPCPFRTLVAGVEEPPVTGNHVPYLWGPGIRHSRDLRVLIVIRFQDDQAQLDLAGAFAGAGRGLAVLTLEALGGRHGWLIRRCRAPRACWAGRRWWSRRRGCRRRSGPLAAVRRRLREGTTRGHGSRACRPGTAPAVR
jgi:hypothetical protein